MEFRRTKMILLLLYFSTFSSSVSGSGDSIFPSTVTIQADQHCDSEIVQLWSQATELERLSLIPHANAMRTASLKVRSDMERSSGWIRTLQMLPQIVSDLAQLIFIVKDNDFSLNASKTLPAQSQILYPNSFLATLVQISHSEWKVLSNAYHRMDHIKRQAYQVPQMMRNIRRLMEEENLPVDSPLRNKMLKKRLTHLAGYAQRGKRDCTATIMAMNNLIELINEVQMAALSNSQVVDESRRQIESDLAIDQRQRDQKILEQKETTSIYETTSKELRDMNKLFLQTMENARSFTSDEVAAGLLTQALSAVVNVITMSAGGIRKALLALAGGNRRMHETLTVQTAQVYYDRLIVAKKMALNYSTTQLTQARERHVKVLRDLQQQRLDLGNYDIQIQRHGHQQDKLATLPQILRKASSTLRSHLANWRQLEKFFNGIDAFTEELVNEIDGIHSVMADFYDEDERETVYGILTAIQRDQFYGYEANIVATSMAIHVMTSMFVDVMDVGVFANLNRLARTMVIQDQAFDVDDDGYDDEYQHVLHVAHNTSIILNHRLETMERNFVTELDNEVAYGNCIASLMNSEGKRPVRELL